MRLGRCYSQIIVAIATTAILFVLSYSSSANNVAIVLQDEGATSMIPHHNGTKIKIVCNANGTTCVDPLGVVGKWTHMPNRNFAAPTCCGWDSSENELKNIGPCRTKIGFNEFFYRGHPSLVNLVGGHGCLCNTIDPFHDEYVWESPTLQQTFDSIDTCALLGNRSVLFIGDSVMGQATSTLMNSLMPGGCQTQIMYGMSDTLVDRLFGVLNRGVHWKEHVEREQPDIVIVSVGGHIQEGDSVYLKVIDEVLNGIKAVQLEKPNIIFGWKTQQPAGCMKEISLDPVQAARSFSDYDYPYHGRFYHWDLLLLSRLQHLGMPFLDLRMLYSRGDAHRGMRGVIENYRKNRDCLHFCIPGPLDVIGRLFHKFLLDIEE